MKRLISAGLMFGNLIEVSSPALIERYNRALKNLTGKTTNLTDFHIDISGYSPEIGDELQDDLYLNPNGCNRQFILLTTAQKSAPLLNIKFSTSRGIMRQFIETNEAQLFALDGWRDDLLIAEMIGLAKKTGDVTRVPIALPKMSFEQANYWTAHFGGIYLFRGLARPAVISALPRATLGEVPIPAMDLSRRNEIADWLERNKLVEPIVQARGMDAGAVLRQKMDFILVDAADALNLDLGAATRADLRKIAQRLGADLPAEFQGLAALLRWVEGGGDWPRITSEHPGYFYTLRARKHADRDLVNMLLAELAPLDVRQMFIVHKELFYKSYATWSDRKRGYVVDFLAREYQVDKAGARAALFGAEPGMDDQARPEPKPTRDLGALVGPWGALRKGRS
jgi:hypothetical protein